MKSTKIIRRVDDLGRIVIPKEIRRTMKICEGDPIEIFTDNDMLILKKHDYKEEIKEHINNIASCDMSVSVREAFRMFVEAFNADLQ